MYQTGFRVPKEPNTPLIREHTLNHTNDPYLASGKFLKLRGIGLFG